MTQPQPRRRKTQPRARPTPHVRRRGWQTNSQPRYDANGRRIKGRSAAARAAALWRKRSGQGKRIARAARHPVRTAQARRSAAGSRSTRSSPARRSAPPRRSTRRRLPRRRGALFAIFSVAVASLALTAVVVELASLVTVSALTVAAEGVAAAAAWWIGEPPVIRQSAKTRPAGTGPTPAGQSGTTPTGRKRVCYKTCRTSTAPVASCKCVCGGHQHGKGMGGQTSKPQPRRKPAGRKPAAKKPAPKKAVPTP